MPVYEYACKACRRHVEVAQSFKDEPLTTCEVCRGPLRKVFGTIGVVLKGSGFYRTDSRNDSRARKEKSEKSDKAEKSDKGDKRDKGDKGDKVAAKSESSKSESKSESRSGGTSDAKSDSKPKAADTAKSA